MAPPSMDASSSEIVTLSAKIMIAAIMVVFFMMAFLFFIHIYAQWYWSRNEDPTIVSWRRRTARHRRAAAVSARRRGMDPTVIRSLPTVEYNPKDFKEGLECPVCLSEVSEGEKIRLLPKCNHGFHVECIDMWFHSHSTCPLCRNPVASPENPSTNSDQEIGVSISSSESESESESDDDQSSYDSVHSIEVPSFPTNVLFWGNEAQVTSLQPPSEEGCPSSSSSSSSSSLVIEIPKEHCEGCLMNEEEGKSPGMKRLRSLKRLLSRGKRVAPSPTSGSTSSHVEQV